MAEMEESEKETAKLLEETKRIERAQMQRQADPNTGKFHDEEEGEEGGDEGSMEGGTPASGLGSKKGLKRTTKESNLQEATTPSANHPIDGGLGA